MKKLLYILSIIAIQLNAQTITPHVINSAGNSYTFTSVGNNYNIDFNIGETIITTVSSTTNIVTQGFLQPDISSIGGIVFSPLLSHETCLNKNDGSIKIDVKSFPTNSYLLFKWSPDSVCQSSLNYNCPYIDSLTTTTYTLILLALDNNTSALRDSIYTTFSIMKSYDECSQTLPIIYHAFSPGNDGLNDTWIIPNITDFPENVVTFYNRWGVELNRIPNYNNKDKVWDGATKSGNKLTNGTYFYVIELNNGTKPLKGWLEITGSN